MKLDLEINHQNLLTCLCSKQSLVIQNIIRVQSWKNLIIISVFILISRIIIRINKRRILDPQIKENIKAYSDQNNHNIQIIQICLKFQTFHKIQKMLDSKKYHHYQRIQEQPSQKTKRDRWAYLKIINHKFLPHAWVFKTTTCTQSKKGVYNFLKLEFLKTIWNKKVHANINPPEQEANMKS